MRKLYICLVVPVLLALPAQGMAGELKLTMQNGLVSVSAQNVPLSMILAEWARIGQTRIVNGDKILTPVSLELVNVPERKALDILLRSVSGYMLAERPTQTANASVFDRIMILPTSRPPANTGPVNAVPPPFNAPRPIPAQPMPVMEDDVGPNVMPPDAGPQTMPGQPPVPGQPSMPGQPPVPGQPSMPGQVPTQNTPLTAPRPGQLPQPVQQQPVPFGTPRPPGTGPGGGPGGPGGAPPGGPGGGPGGPGGASPGGPGGVPGGSGGGSQS